MILSRWSYILIQDKTNEPVESGASYFYFLFCTHTDFPVVGIFLERASVSCAESEARLIVIAWLVLVAEVSPSILVANINNEIEISASNARIRESSVRSIVLFSSAKFTFVIFYLWFSRKAFRPYPMFCDLISLTSLQVCDSTQHLFLWEIQSMLCSW